MDKKIGCVQHDCDECQQLINRVAKLEEANKLLVTAIQNVVFGSPLDDEGFNRDDDDLNTYKQYRCINLNDKNMVSKWESTLENALRAVENSNE